MPYAFDGRRRSQAAATTAAILIALATLSGCSELPDRNERGCTLATTSPETGADDLPVVTAALSMTFNVALAAEQVAGAVTLESAQDGDVPGELAIEDDGRTLTFRPSAPLRFDDALTLRAAEVTDARGLTCEGELAVRTRAPVRVPQDLLPAPPLDLARSGSFLYSLGIGVQGLQVYRINDPDTLELRANLDLGVSPRRLAPVGADLYVAARGDGFLTVDVSAEASPIVIGETTEVTEGCELPGGCRFEDIVDVDVFETPGRRIVAAADNREGVWLVQVDVDPPRLVSFVEIRASEDEPATILEIDIAEDGDRRLLAVANGDQGAAVIDVSDPDAPTPVSDSGPITFVRDVALAGDVLVLAQGPRMESRDVDDLAAGSLDRENRPVPSVNFRRVTVRDGTVHAAGRRGGQLSYAIDDAGQMTDLVLRPTDGASIAVLATDERVYLGGGGGVLAAELDGASAEATADPGFGEVLDVDFRDGSLFAIADGRGLHVFDTVAEGPTVAVPRTTTPVPSLRDSTSAPNSVIATDDYVAVGDGRAPPAEGEPAVAQLLVFDPSGDEPVVVGTAAGQDEVGDLTTFDRTVLACSGNAGVAAFDLSDLAAPVRTELFDLGGVLCGAIDRSGSTAFAGTDRVNRLDVSDLGDIEELPALVFPGGDLITGIAVDDDVVFLTTESVDPVDGSATALLRAFDIDGTDLVEFSTSVPLTSADDVVVRGPFVFVAGGVAGVYVFDRRDLRAQDGDVEALANPGSEGQVVALTVGEEAVYGAQRGAGVIVVDTGPLP